MEIRITHIPGRPYRSTIETIKFVRASLGVNLKMAKDIFDQVQAEDISQTVTVEDNLVDWLRAEGFRFEIVKSGQAVIRVWLKHAPEGIPPVEEFRNPTHMDYSEGVLIVHISDTEGVNIPVHNILRVQTTME